MPDIIAGLVVVAVLVGGVLVAVRAVTAPSRADAEARKTEAHEGHVVTANHRDLFLTVERLLSDTDRGLNTPFLTPEELQQARDLCAAYRNEVN